MIVYRFALALAPLVLLLSCGAGDPAPAPDPAADSGSGTAGPEASTGWLDAEPKEAFARLEQHLVGSGALSLVYDITAEGPVTARVAGPLARRADGYTEFRANGTLNDRTLAAMCLVDSAKLSIESGSNFQEVEVPEKAQDAIFGGMMRTGLLHNIYRLSVPLVPDGAEKGVDSVFRTTDHRWEGEGEKNGVPCKALSFDILKVDAEGATSPAGGALLWLNAETGLPVLREQTVRFDEGEMRVVESYRYQG